MTLHFNLKNVFALSLILMFWHLLLSYTFLGVVICISLFAFYLKYCRQNFSSLDFGFAGAFLFNLWYILESWGNVRQYDYFNFVMHVDYFLKNEFFFSQPLSYFSSVYFQPPLWGFLSAVVTKLIILWEPSQALAFDYVRFVSLFCISASYIIFWRLFNIFDFRDNLKYCLWLLFCFFPIHTIFANLVNNDAPLYCCMLAIIYLAYRWYLFGEWKDTLFLALFICLAGLTKFSGLMLIPAIGVLMLFRLLNANDKLDAKMWLQFLVIVVAALLSFAWGWFLLFYDFPLVPPPVKNNDFQDLSSFSIWQRFTDFSSLSVIFADVRNGVSEPNVWLALIKTSLFGEWAWKYNIWAFILYFEAILLAFLSVLGGISLLFYKIGKDWSFNAFIIVTVFSVLAAWINFWIDYPFFCSSEFRYVIILFPLSLLGIANLLQNISLPRYLYYILTGLLGLFIFAKFMLYLSTI